MTAMMTPSTTRRLGDRSTVPSGAGATLHVAVAVTAVVLAHRSREREVPGSA
jgi:hypothetical protein